MVVTLCFTLGDVDSILASPTDYPFIQVFYNATKSYAGTDIMVTIVIVTLTASCLAIVTTASRQLWAFARDNGVPYSSVLSHVSQASLESNLVTRLKLIASGLPSLEHSYSRCHGLLPRRCPSLSDQHRLINCSERHLISQHK